MAQAQEVFVFSPTQIPGCQLWLDASDRATITTSGSVMSQWTDKSGLSKTVTFAGTSNTYSPSLQAVSTDNATTSYFFANVNLKKSVIPYATVFTVHTWTGSGLSSANQALWGQDIGGGWNRFQLLGFTASPAFAYGLSYTPNSPNVTTVSALNTSARALYSASYAYQISNGTFAYVNGTLASTTVTEAVSPSETATTNTYFGTIDTGYAGTVAFHEILIFTSQITTAQRQTIEGYLAWKWGLQANLPSDHPFRRYRPLAQPPFPTTLSPAPRITQGTQPFVPTQISGCQLWLDAADPSSLVVSGSNVTQWRDKSANGNHFSSAGLSTSPTTGTYNGLTTIYWTSSNQQLVSSQNNATPGSAARTMFVLEYNPLITSCVYLVTGTEAGANPATCWGYGKNSNADYSYPFLYSSAGADIFTFVQIRNSPTILTSTFDGSSTLTGWITGDYQITKSTGLNTTAGVWYLGRRQQAAVGSIDSYFLEILQYNSAFTTAQRQQVEGYLAWKWGFVSSLPDGHPYKAQPIAPFPFRSTAFQGSLSVWVPTRISGCLMWLDGADRSTLTLSGTNVTQWNDKSGQGYTLTVPSGRTSPTYSNGVLNTTGTNALWSTTNFAISGNAQVTLFLVYSTTTTTGNLGPGAYIGSANAASPPTFFGIGTYQTTSNAISFVASVFEPDVYITLTPNTGGARMMACGFYTGAQINGTYNGTLLTPQTLTVANFSVQPFQIGLRTANNSPSIDGTICESVCYNFAVSTAQRQQVEGYLAWKWGLQGSLPATHPFKNFPPSP